MNVVIQINVRDAIRDAIPVRAIPFLTSWQKFSPDVLAAVLAQFDEALLANGMRGLTAYRMGDEGVCAIPAYWWSNFVYRELCALSDAIRARQETQETGYQEWREQSIRILPAGVFVWRDEFEAGYARTLDKWQRVAGAVLDSLVLNLRPDIPPKYPASLILEGFTWLDMARATNKATQSQWDRIKNDLNDRHSQHTESLHNEWQGKLDPAPTPRVEPHTAPAQEPATPAPVVDTKPDVILLATRQQLIDAFGSFTGMNVKWFSNIKDTPALLAARKVTGQGGRGHIAEPLFCPFEVLQWLIDPARRKGRLLKQDKGWELFERHFPRAYAAFSIGDPRTD